jgi:hypothetical protein
MSALNLKRPAGMAEQSQLATAAVAHAREIWVSIYFPEISLATQQASNRKPFAVLVQQQGKTRI